jgi:hypothetical protein
MDIKKMVDDLITNAGGTPSVDRTKRTTTGGMDPDRPEHRELSPNGQQKDYVILTAEERARGFVRPVRRTYVHVACGTATTMALAIAETYARDPHFYGGTYCVACRQHFQLFGPDREGEEFKANFKWDDGSGVGT